MLSRFNRFRDHFQTSRKPALRCCTATRHGTFPRKGTRCERWNHQSTSRDGNSSVWPHGFYGGRPRHLRRLQRKHRWHCLPRLRALNAWHRLHSPRPRSRLRRHIPRLGHDLSPRRRSCGKRIQPRAITRDIPRSSRIAIARQARSGRFAGPGDVPVWDRDGLCSGPCVSSELRDRSFGWCGPRGWCWRC